MKGRLTRYLLLTTVSACFIFSVLAQNSTYKELPNFHQVNGELYRGAQPGKDGYQRLAHMGVKTVVNLRNDDQLAQAEAKDVRALGLTYFNIPLNTWRRPTDEQVNRVLAIISDPANQPVFVHCRRGADRTGTMIAVYRISHDGWNTEQAKAEANRFGMHLWEVGMKDYIHDYYQRQQTK